MILLQYLLCFVIVDLLELYYKRPRLGLFSGPKITILQADPTGSKVTPERKDSEHIETRVQTDISIIENKNKLRSSSAFGISDIVDNYK